MRGKPSKLPCSPNWTVMDLRLCTGSLRLASRKSLNVSKSNVRDSFA